MKAILRNWIPLICILFSLIISCASNPHSSSRIPDWISYETINHVFPENEYLARTRSGVTPYAAQINADSELSAYFNQNIKSITQAEDNYLNKNNSTTSQKTLSRSITITSDSELIGLRHTDSYFSKKENLYYICAYINRNEAWNLIEPKLKIFTTNFENTKISCKNESEPFNRVILQNRILKEADDFYKLYYLAYCLSPDNTKNYSHIDTQLQKLSQENFNLKNTIKLQIITNSNTSDQIKIKTEELLTKEGFVISQTKTSYLATINTNIIAEKTNEIYSVYPQFQISITKSDGTALANYSKQLNKISSYTKETAERLAINKLTTDLDNNLINNLLYKQWSE